MLNRQYKYVNKLCYTNYTNVWKTHHTKFHAQMVFPMLTTWCSKHVEDAKNWIKTLIWKSVQFVGLLYILA